MKENELRIEQYVRRAAEVRSDNVPHERMSKTGERCCLELLPGYVTVSVNRSAEVGC